MRCRTVLTALVLMLCLSVPAWLWGQSDEAVQASADESADEMELAPPGMTPEEAARRLLEAEAADPEPTVAQLKGKLALREAEIRRLHDQILLLIEEIQRLRTENEGLRIAVQALAATGLDDAAKVPTTQPVDPDENNGVTDELPPEQRPNASLQYALGLIDLGGGSVTIVQTSTDVFGHRRVRVREHPNIDHDNVLIRGTLANESQLPYRYTFEIRIGGKTRVAAAKPPIIGSWRYQTPVLQPGEIHQFEVKVPVTEVGDVVSYEIGNIVADRPVQQQSG